MITQVQKHLREDGIDGWLLYDFRRSNDLACTFLQIPQETHLTRRFFYWIPKEGDPVQIVSAVEAHLLSHLPGKKRVFLNWEELHSHLKEILAPVKTVAMEYSFQNQLPYVSKVDGGTIELIRSFGVKIASSANFLQFYTCLLSEKQVKLHRKAGEILDEIATATWRWLSHCLKEDRTVGEYEVQQKIHQDIERHGCLTDSFPMCSVGPNSANPHYSPTIETSAPIRKGDLIQIDLWCKCNEKNSIYADISRVAVAASHPTEEQEKVFTVVRAAQKAVVTLLQQKSLVRGCEADQAARSVIEQEGYGAYFTHRTGHNIYEETHGPGAHLDSFETKDERYLIPGTCFSVEPAIYLPGKFGLRLEHDVYLDPQGQVHITGGTQDEIVRLP